MITPFYLLTKLWHHDCIVRELFRHMLCISSLVSYCFRKEDAPFYANQRCDWEGNLPRPGYQFRSDWLSRQYQLIRWKWCTRWGVRVEKKRIWWKGVMKQESCKRDTEEVIWKSGGGNRRVGVKEHRGFKSGFALPLNFYGREAMTKSIKL